MAVATDGRSAPGTAAPPVRRRLETWVAGVGVALSLLVMGGFALVMNAVDERTFAEAGIDPSGAGAPAVYEAARTLAAWFGFTLLVVLALCAVGLLAARKLPERRATGWWFLGAGVACLVGSQLLLFPLAFFFFLTAGLFALRRVDPGSTR